MSPPPHDLLSTAKALQPEFDRARYERIVADLRANHGRVTSARAAIITTLLRAQGHVTADDVAVVVQATHPQVHLSTIYRTLDALESIGVVDHAHLGHGRAVYHLTDAPHQHLVCEICGSVIEVPDELFTDLGTSLDQHYGFSMRLNHFAVLGCCRHCRI